MCPSMKSRILSTFLISALLIADWKVTGIRERTPTQICVVWWQLKVSSVISGYSKQLFSGFFLQTGEYGISLESFMNLLLCHC